MDQTTQNVLTTGQPTATLTPTVTCKTCQKPSFRCFGGRSEYVWQLYRWCQSVPVYGSGYWLYAAFVGALAAIEKYYGNIVIPTPPATTPRLPPQRLP